MVPASKRWTIKRWMIAIALISVILYTWVLFERSYTWMVKAGW
jgi:hypothetical protein